jgi:23S rRNA (pseudouridine1915-N3)-methyltransferase
LKIRIVALGGRMPAWVDAAFADYVKRMPRDYAVGLVEIKPAPRNEGRPVQQMLEVEAARIEQACANHRLIACDERGRAWSTRALADALQQWHDGGDDIAFVIGSADGLAPRIRERADLQLSLSSFTLPHGLVRVMLAEQLYRAVSLVTGHPYHRE